jgi:hypothetical protein
MVKLRTVSAISIVITLVRAFYSKHCGTCEMRVSSLSWHSAEHSGYFSQKPNFVSAAKQETGEIPFYDSNSGKLLFTAPTGRTMGKFLDESKAHGWPSFRDQEVNWEYVRCLPNGECVSVDGTHLVRSFFLVHFFSLLRCPHNGTISNTTGA